MGDPPPRMVRQRMRTGMGTGTGPFLGLVLVRLRKNCMYRVWLRVRPPEIMSSSHRTTTTFWPDSSSLATIEAAGPKGARGRR